MIRFDERNQRWRWEFDRYLADGPGGKVKRVRRSKLLARGLSKEQAEVLAATMEAEAFTRVSLVHRATGWDEYVNAMLSDRQSWIYEQVVRTKHRAKTSGMAGVLSATDVAELLIRSRGRCEVTGMKFQLGKPARSRVKPYFHSIDRIDCSRGYEPWNCRIVCFAVNVAMNNWGEDVFAQLATGYVMNKYCAITLLASESRAKSPQPGIRERHHPEGRMMA